MRKLGLLGVVAAFTALPALVEAQESTISASASIPTTFTIDGEQDVMFGEIDQEEANHEQEQAGRFRIVHNSAVTVYFIEEAPLTYTGEGSETIPVNWTCNINRLIGDPGTLGSCADESDHTVSWANEGKVTSYFHVGGTVDGTTLDSHPLGAYEGTLKLTATNPDD